MNQPEPNPPAAAKPAPSTRPALLYVLGAFGLVIGALTSAASLDATLGLLAPRDVYVKALVSSNGAQVMMAPADFERFAGHEAEARYDRRNAALPLAIAGVVVSCLLFSGALRCMMGQGAALGTWLLAAAVSLPHRLLTLTLSWLTVADIRRALGGAPAAAMLETQLDVEQLAALLLAGILMIYFSVCLIYLRRPGVRASFG